MVKLANSLSRLQPAKILVIGDMVVDSYTFGKAKRISPEAPVPVVNVQSQDHRPGGAGNVILNLISLGADVVAMGRIGNDWAGDLLINALEREQAITSNIVRQSGYPTPVKNRIIVDHQQIVRIDHEQITPLDESLEQYLIEQLPEILLQVQVVAISDYGKGFLTSTLLSAIMEEANRLGIIVITDPKGNDFKKYKGTTIIKPNLSEAYAAANLPLSAPLEKASATVIDQCQAKMLMVTRSEAGISLFDHKGKRWDFPVQAKEVKDVTGAGDTVLAMLAYALANKLTYEEAVQLCNVAAGIAIEHVGCTRVSLSDLAFRLFETNGNQKVFDQEHLFVVNEILKRQPYRLLKLYGMDQVTPSLFRMIKQLTENGEPLLIYIEDNHPSETLIEMLSSMKEVSFIVLHLDNIEWLSRLTAPSEKFAFNSL